MPHRREPHSRIDDWLANLPPEGVRAMCSWERFGTFAREPERRKVGVDARIVREGTVYEVDPDLAGEAVILWWGLFDTELYVERGERRYGPYAPVGGPIPLHHYRSFKKTKTQQRAERIATLAERLALEEIGARTALFWLDGIKGQERAYLDWLLGQCTAAGAPEVLTTPASERLAAALSTPLQIEQYLGLALEAAYRIGQRPVTLEVVESVLAADLDALEAALTRYGYGARDLAELLAVRPAEVRAFLRGQLAPGRTQELHGQLLAAGLPV